MRYVCSMILTLFVCACVKGGGSDSPSSDGASHSAAITTSSSSGSGSSGIVTCSNEYQFAFRLEFPGKYKRQLQSMTAIAHSEDGQSKYALVPSTDNELVYVEQDELPAEEKEYFIEFSSPDIKTQFIENLVVKQDECGKHITLVLKADVNGSNGGGNNLRTVQVADDSPLEIEPLYADESI